MSCYDQICPTRIKLVLLFICLTKMVLNFIETHYSVCHIVAWTKLHHCLKFETTPLKSRIMVANFDNFLTNASLNIAWLLKFLVTLLSASFYDLLTASAPNPEGWYWILLQGIEGMFRRLVKLAFPDSGTEKTENFTMYLENLILFVVTGANKSILEKLIVSLMIISGISISLVRRTIT
jgi:hypothetical protein